MRFAGWGLEGDTWRWVDTYAFGGGARSDGGGGAGSGPSAGA